MAELSWFHKVDCNTTPDGRTLIRWEMARRLALSGPTTINFYIAFARSCGPWTRLNADDPVVDACMWTDTNKRSWGMLKDVHYRVEAEDPDEEKEDEAPFTIHVSPPVQATGGLDRNSWLEAREICRMVDLANRKKGGRHGFLLKRRTWGTLCHKCGDFDLSESRLGSCDICYGVGIEGGYFPGVDLWLRAEPSSPKEESPTPTGTSMQWGLQGMCVAFPWMSPLDIWVDGSSNERYVIRKVAPSAEIQGKAILANLELMRLPDTDISLSVPIAAANETFNMERYEIDPVQFVGTQEEEGDKVVSTAASVDQGWRRGLKGDF